MKIRENSDGFLVVEIIPRKIIFTVDKHNYDIKRHFYFNLHLNIKDRLRFFKDSLRFNIKVRPKSRAKVFTLIWLPLIHIENNNGYFSIGNKYKLSIFHNVV